MMTAWHWTLDKYTDLRLATLGPGDDWVIAAKSARQEHKISVSAAIDRGESVGLAVLAAYVRQGKKYAVAYERAGRGSNGSV